MRLKSSSEPRRRDKPSRLSFRPKVLDIAILAVALAATVFISVKIYSGGADQLYVHVTGESGEWIEPLSAHKELEIPGPLGITYVEIEGGKARIMDSPCENKLCVAMGEIDKENQWIACLPNRVFVRIGGRAAGEEGIDAGTF